MKKIYKKQCPKCNGAGHTETINGVWLRQIRLIKKMSLSELSRLSGYAVSTLSEIERNKKNCTEKVLRAYLGITGSGKG